MKKILILLLFCFMSFSAFCTISSVGMSDFNTVEWISANESVDYYAGFELIDGNFYVVYCSRPFDVYVTDKYRVHVRDTSGWDTNDYIKVTASGTSTPKLYTSPYSCEFSVNDYYPEDMPYLNWGLTVRSLELNNINSTNVALATLSDLPLFTSNVSGFTVFDDGTFTTGVTDSYTIDYTSWIFMGSPFHAYESYEGSVPTKLSIDYSEIADDVADDGFISDVGFYYNNIIDITSLEINGRVWWASSDYMGYVSSMNYGSFTENLNEYTNVSGYLTFDLPYSLFGSGNNYIDIFYEYMEDDLCKSGQVSQELYIGNGEILGSPGLPDNISDIIAGVYDPQNNLYENATTAEEHSANLLQKILNAINAPFLLLDEIFTSIYDTVSGFFAFFGQVFSFLPPQILMIVMFGLSLTLVLRILGR